MNNSQSLHFLTRSIEHQDAGQCDCNCDCACSPQVAAERTLFESPASDSLILSPAAGVQFHALDDHNYVTAGAGASPAVFSSGCLDLFRMFPARPLDVLEQLQGRWDAETVRDTIRDMFRHGLLLDAEAVTVPTTHSVVLSAWIHLTSQCNLACRYCYLPNVSERLSPEVGKGIVDAILRSAVLHQYSKIRLKYAGGEPLLNFPVLIENFQYARRQCTEAGIALEGKVISNGSLLSREIVQQLLDNGLELTVSLDGLQPYHDANRPLHSGKGSFAAVKNGILLAVEMGLKPGISITISNESASGLADLVGWLLDLDLRFTFNFYRENARSQQHQDLKFQDQHILSALFEAYQRIESRKPDFQFWSALGDRVNIQYAHAQPCSLGKDYLVFDVNGNLASCQMEMQAVLADYHHPDPVHAIRTNVSEPQNVLVDEKAECAACEWKSLCSGGCPVLAKQVTGSCAARSPYCAIYKQIVPMLLRAEAKSILAGYPIVT